MALPTAAAPGSTSVYWVGQDGNVYMNAAGTSGGVQNMGKAINVGANGFDSVGASAQATQIADPNAPAPTNTAPTQNPNGGSSGTQYQDKSNEIGLLQSGLGSVDATANTGIGKINEALNKITGQYEGDLTKAADSYGSNSDSNQTDLQGNKQATFQHAVQGRQGLYSTLGSLGALNGTGVNLANKAVQDNANADLTTAADTFATNQRGLDTSYNTYTDSTKKAEQKAKDAGANNIQQVQNDAAKSKLDYLTKLATDYQLEGNTGQAKTYTDQASALFPSIAATSVPTIDMGYTGGAYSAPTLSQYVGKANNTTVKSTAPTPGSLLNIPGLVAMNKKQGA